VKTRTAWTRDNRVRIAIKLLFCVEIRRSRVRPKEGVLITVDGLERVCRQSFIALDDRLSVDISGYNTTMSISHFPLLENH
jgi:hypothetical protein